MGRWVERLDVKSDEESRLLCGGRNLCCRGR